MYDNLIRDVHEVVSMNVKGPLTEDSGSRCRQIMCKSEDVMKVRERNDSYLTSLARIIQDVLNEAEKANRVSHKLEESVAKQRKLISKLTQ
jgi:methyl-accepting chemotaxis protein